MTATHAVLLRGINVGKAKRVAMADLRRAIESLGATDVRTLLNSGNAVLTWPRASASATVMGRAIEDAVETRLGVHALVVVLARSELARILDELPRSVASFEPSRVLVGVTPTAVDLKSLAAACERDWSPEILEVGRRAVTMGLPKGIADSKLVMAVDAATKKRVTSRNLATMRKLLALMEADGR